MSGICVCGHKWDNHHLGMIVKPEYVETTSGPEHYIPQECEAFGNNEMGGLDKDGNVHCFGYKDKNEVDDVGSTK